MSSGGGGAQAWVLQGGRLQYCPQWILQPFTLFASFIADGVDSLVLINVFITDSADRSQLDNAATRRLRLGSYQQLLDMARMESVWRHSAC